MHPAQTGGSGGIGDSGGSVQQSSGRFSLDSLPHYYFPQLPLGQLTLLQ